MIAMTFGFVFVFEYFWMMVVLLYLSRDYDRTRPTNVEMPTADVLVTYAVYRSILPVRILAPSALGLVVYQAVLFTRHWVYLQTTSPLPAGDRSPNKGRPRSIAPAVYRPASVHAPSGHVSLRENPGRVWQAWESYLNYGKGGVKGARRISKPRGKPPIQGASVLRRRVRRCR